MISSSGGGLTGQFQFSGAQDLTVPVSTLIANSGGNFYRVALNNTATCGTSRRDQLLQAPAAINIMSLVAPSISAGYSSLGVAKNGTNITSYDGGGWRTQLYANLAQRRPLQPQFCRQQHHNLYAVNPSQTNILTVANQTSSEVHPGYTPGKVLAKLNGNDGSGGNDGGYWLAPGNGVESHSHHAQRRRQRPAGRQPDRHAGHSIAMTRFYLN